MRDEIYVGALISERGFEHSTGLWKHHKYIKKIGDRYIYAKNKAGEVRDKLGETAEKAADKAKDLAWDAQLEAEWKAELAGDAVKRAAKAITDPITGASYRRSAKHYARVAKVNEEVGADLRDRARQTAGEFDKRTTKAYRKGAERERKDATDARGMANYYRSKYNKTLGGRIENAVNAAGRKVTKRKRLAESVKDTKRRSEDKAWDSSHNRNMSKLYRDRMSSGLFKSSVPGEYSSLARYHAKKSKTDAQSSVALKRLSAARQSEYERTSLKGRTERAKKRVAKALKRIRRKR